MITELYFVVLQILPFVLLFHMVLDLENRIYANIASGMVSWILFFFNAWALLTGEVIVDQATATAMLSAGMAGFNVMMGLIALIYFLGLSIEIVRKLLEEI